MMIRKGFKFRLKIERFQNVMLLKFAGCNRFVWNTTLGIQKERVGNDLSYLSYNKTAKMLIEMKSEFIFLKEVHSQTLQQTLKNLDSAIHDAFDKSSPKKLPKFKKRGIDDSFRFPQGFKINGNVLYLPKIGWIPFFKSRDIEGTPKNVTVSRQGRHWFVSAQTEIEVAMPMHLSCGSAGIDMGVKHFVTLSDGSYFEPLNSFKRLEKKLACEQRKLSKKKLKSHNWYKQKAVVDRIHAKIANASRDYLHKGSTIVGKNYAMTVIEDLKVSNMSASAKATLESPGCNVRQKAGLNKAMLDQVWSEFRRCLSINRTGEAVLLWLYLHIILLKPALSVGTCVSITGSFRLF